jgi:photosystem II stability/assembly factor-like uncharacterized protein
LKAIKLVLFVFIISITFFYNGCGKADTSGSSATPTWQVISEPEALFARNMGGFLNEKYGITVGYSGEIYYTKDSGKTWKSASNSSLCLFGLSIVNNKIAYACGNGTFVVKTTDGGANWKTASYFGEYEPNQPRYLSFVDENTGWIATPNKFLFNGKKIVLGSTDDGGSTWTSITLPDEIEEIVSIYLRTAQDGYIIDNKGNLYITADSGKSFTVQPLNIEDIYLKAKFEQYTVLKFFDENNAFIAYETKRGKLAAARSSDGGKTWTNEVVPDLQIGPLFLSPDGKILTLAKAGDFIKVLQYK